MGQLHCAAKGNIYIRVFRFLTQRYSRHDYLPENNSLLTTAPNTHTVL